MQTQQRYTLKTSNYLGKDDANVSCTPRESLEELLEFTSL